MHSEMRAAESASPADEADDVAAGRLLELVVEADEWADVNSHAVTNYLDGALDRAGDIVERVERGGSSRGARTAEKTLRNALALAKAAAALGGAG